MSKEKKRQDRPASRVSFTDSKAQVPQTMAVDARPMAGEVFNTDSYRRLLANLPECAATFNDRIIGFAPKRS